MILGVGISTKVKIRSADSPKRLADGKKGKLAGAIKKKVCPGLVKMVVPGSEIKKRRGGKKTEKIKNPAATVMTGCGVRRVKKLRARAYAPAVNCAVPANLGLGPTVKSGVS